MVKPIHALLDCDLWCYDIAFAAECAEEGDLGTSFCRMMVDKRTVDVLKNTGAKTFEMHLTGSDNFRHDIATILPYKGNRVQPRPKYYNYIRSYLIDRYGAYVVHGMEADDYLSIRQTNLSIPTVIVSRDKDLRQVPGYHYGYKSGRQLEFKLKYYDELGELVLNKSKLTGGGNKFLYAQCIMGDSTDNIQGIKGAGPAKAYKELNECKNELQLYQKTRQCYVEYYGDEEDALQALLENMRLVYMVRELDSNNKPIMFDNSDLEEQCKELLKES